MARRSSPIEDLMTLSAKMPWPAGVVAAIASFLALHMLAAHYSAAAGPVSNVADLGSVARRGSVGALASLLQYVAPVALLIGAGISFWRRSRGGILHGQARAGGAHAIDAMSWAQFEILVAQAFRQRGYSVIDNPMGGPDGGIDLVLRKSGQDFLVQCKQWRTKTIGVTVVRELYRVVMSRGAAGGFLVTSGRFTADAQRFASDCSIELIDGRQLVQMIGGIVGSIKRDPLAGRAFPAAPVLAADIPHCPRCDGAMVRRKARQSGSEFFGCVGFPWCRGTVSI